MSNTALITGASGGIGRELARIHASKGGNLVLVARREEALQELKEELIARHKVSVTCLAEDLTAEGAPQRIYDQIETAGIQVDVLINNAGFGGHGLFHERRWEEDESMIDLNVTALCEMSHLFIPGMVARKKGKILNVASMAAFLPGPLQAVYYATKAFVVSFSQALAEELREYDITVTALCPGAVNTGFASRANVEDVSGFNTMAKPTDVAKAGYQGMERGKLIVSNKWSYMFMKNWILPFLPSRMLLRMSRQSMEKNN